MPACCVWLMEAVSRLTSIKWECQAQQRNKEKKGTAEASFGQKSSIDLENKTSIEIQETMSPGSDAPAAHNTAPQLYTPLKRNVKCREKDGSLDVSIVKDFVASAGYFL